MKSVRHILGISGGKDSAALAIYLKDKYPQLRIQYYNSDTGCELEETEVLINRLETYLGGITKIRAAAGSPEPTPFEHFLKAMGNFLPSPQARWCTKKMKLDEMEKFVGDEPTISYVGIRGDEDRDGYISTKPNIQAIFPFRKNIWSTDVVNKFLADANVQFVEERYRQYASDTINDELLNIIRSPLSNEFTSKKKADALLDSDTKLFNKIVFDYLKTTDYPVGMLDEFPLVDNDDVLVIDDIFRILEDSGIGVPSYYKPIPFEVDGKVGMYNRSRSGCFFCFYQQRIEWIWLYEQHPELFKKAMEFEKDGYTWYQNESLADMIKPERIRQIKLDTIKKQEAQQSKKSCKLIDMLDDDTNDIVSNCFN